MVCEPPPPMGPAQVTDGTHSRGSAQTFVCLECGDGCGSAKGWCGVLVLPPPGGPGVLYDNATDWQMQRRLQPTQRKAGSQRMVEGMGSCILEHKIMHVWWHPPPRRVRSGCLGVLRQGGPGVGFDMAAGGGGWGWGKLWQSPGDRFLLAQSKMSAKKCRSRHF